MRSLVLLHEGAPTLVSVTAAAIKQRILEMPEDDADLWQVWSVPSDDSLAPAFDNTGQFALTWALEFEFGDGIEPHDYLAPFPAFIRLAVPDQLTRRWELWMAGRDQNFVPNPVRKVA